MSDETRDQDENEESAGASVMELPALEVEEPGMLEPYSPERIAAKEGIRLEFIAGRATLAALAVKYRVPYQTLLTWSKRDGGIIEPLPD